MIALVASTFPRFAGDPEPGFILDFAREVSRFSKVKVFVPNHPLSDDSTDWAGVPVERFRYFPVRSQETLCGDGGIPAKLTTWKGKLLLPFLILAELALFVRLLRDRQVRAIHVHWILPQGLSFALAKALLPRDPRAPMTLLSFHSGRDAKVSRFYLWLEKLIVRSFDRITVNNEKTRQILERLHGRPIGYLSMGLPKDAEAIALPLKKNYRSIASVGRLVAVKGYLELLREWAKRREALKDYSLILLGKGHLAEEIQTFVQSQGLARQIRLHANPSRELIFQTLSEAGYYLQPSMVSPTGQTEGFGLSVVEALHLGCTAVVSAVGGLPEVVGDVGYVCASAGEMLDRLLDGSLQPAGPPQCREWAHRFAWSNKNLQELYF
jgi:glycosyltransferase involved in cell wall biosynthesis